MTEIIIGSKPLSNYMLYAIDMIRKGANKLTIRGFKYGSGKALVLADWLNNNYGYLPQEIQLDRSRNGQIGIKITLLSQQTPITKKVV